MKRLESAVRTLNGLRSKIETMVNTNLAPLARERVGKDALNDLEVAKAFIEDYLKPEEEEEGEGADEED